MRDLKVFWLVSSERPRKEQSPSLASFARALSRNRLLKKKALYEVTKSTDVFHTLVATVKCFFSSLRPPCLCSLWHMWKAQQSMSFSRRRCFWLTHWKGTEKQKAGIISGALQSKVSAFWRCFETCSGSGLRLVILRNHNPVPCCVRFEILTNPLTRTAHSQLFGHQTC